MKNKILLILVSSVMFASCLDQNKDGCPADTLLPFSVEDPFEPDTFDSRLASDVMLYVFKDARLVSGTLIPYEDISGGKEYVIRKDEEISGNLDFIAWSVPNGCDKEPIPQLSPGDNLNDIYRELMLQTRAETNCLPSLDSLHMARVSSSEALDVQTRHILGLNYSDCRVEVRVTDTGNVLSQPGSNPQVSVHGTMSSMNMDKKAIGSEAVVHTVLDCPSGDKVTYTTGRFGVMPSTEGQQVSVKIISNDKPVVTLDAPVDLFPNGAVSGGLLIFEYTLNAPEFTIIVNGFRHNVVIIDDM